MLFDTLELKMQRYVSVQTFKNDYHETSEKN